ncbi:threonine/serine dehydratase [Chromobacterium violaceum]|uniref:Threonine dehydratase n=1 Tax=Chromobacterium violaceum (strain ATCC 12472 / DSM 30191 / JCM 1249 / CCUG 213 / NBRC 12614 / NCIMB 9131 / NCTC 9757 / MK) TaxID=243365 RepID=Q7NT15_CHRVO|nr:threonine/serine dehydratase [Chromobacterium violaceum]AAQ60914.1 threonine dehydratase [Chromobacterium violaceum ATCC 12472]SUX39382.1 L-threonine dehydratase catabolic TdcB [Chromobacterium violaceum]
MNDLYQYILDAHRALRPQVAVTPLSHSPALSALTGCEVYLKCEHLQHTGSFKFRGASNKIRLLDAASRRLGVATVSSGNHGLGVALAGKLAGVPVTVYASAAASEVKLDAIRAHGAKVVVIDAPMLEVELEAARLAERAGLPFVSPYNDVDVIAGQGTIGMELAEQHPGLVAVFASVGGGGMISGIGSALEMMSPSTEIVGCWPRHSQALYQSMLAGEIVEYEELDTISDGTAGGVEPGAITLPIAQRVIGKTALVDEAAIKAAMRKIAEAERWIVEGAAGVAMAGLFQLAEAYRGRPVAVVLCGRNIKLETFLEACHEAA